MKYSKNNLTAQGIKIFYTNIFRGRRIILSTKLKKTEL